MDFLRSYLADKPSGEAPGPAVAKVEWQQIKDYALGLKAPAAPEKRAEELKPAAEKRREEKPREQAVPSLDDILKELDDH